MKLIPAEVILDDILLDPYNPRFLKFDTTSQSELQKRIMNTEEANELLNSMKLSIRWINKIVVREISTLSDEEQSKVMDNTNCKYIVVEGNTRLACLKDKKMDGFINRDEGIPVIIAKEEDDESQLVYESELRLTQGIANVMVVKEWKPIAKAHHIYRIYKDKTQLYPNKTVDQILKDISGGLGVKLEEVRSSVVRYRFYDELSKGTNKLNESKWNFLEVFDVNKKMRYMFGMDHESLNFEWNVNKETQETPFKRELLNAIPQIISTATNEGFNSKELRNIFRKLTLEVKYKAIEDFRTELLDIVNPESDRTWTKIKNEIENRQKNNEEDWQKRLCKMLETLDNFPTSADWAGNAIDILEKIQDKIGAKLSIIKEA